MKTVKGVLALGILLVFFAFCVGNAQTVQVVFFGLRTAPLPLFLFLAAAFILGFLLAALLSALRASRQIARLRRELDGLRRGDRNRTAP